MRARSQLIALVALLAVAVAAGARAPAAYAVAAPGYYTGMSPERQAAIKNGYSMLTRGEYVAPRGLTGGYYGQANGKAIADYVRAVPSTAPGGQPLATGTGQVGVKAKLWPRLADSALGVARGRGAQLALRAFPALGLGAYVVWKIGTTKQVVRISSQPVRATAERFVFTGETPVCVTRKTVGADSLYFGPGPEADSEGNCPAISGVGEYSNVGWSGVPLVLPARSLVVQMWNGSDWQNATDCVSRATGEPGTDRVENKVYYSSYTPPTCVKLSPPGAADYGYSYGTYPFESIQSYIDRGAGAECGGINCMTDMRISWGAGAWFKVVPNDAGVMQDGPRLNDTSLTADVESALPSLPASGAVGDSVAAFLESDSVEAQAHRDAIDTVFQQVPAEGSTVYAQDTQPDTTVSNTGPAYGEFIMPNCSGLTAAACRSALTEAGHTGTVTETTASTAGADLTKPAGAVITTSPGATVKSAPGATVTLTLNPDPLPLAVPAPTPGETATAYTQRLQQLGLVGRVTTLTDLATDPGFGPSEVVRTSPQPGTRVQTGTTVDVTVNPTTAPPATSGLSSDCGLTPPSTALNLGPISGLNLGTVFPFSMIPLVVNALGDINVASSRPNFTVTAFGNQVGDLSYLANFDGVFSAIRLALSFGLTIGAAMFLWRRTLGA